MSETACIRDTETSGEQIKGGHDPSRRAGELITDQIVRGKVNNCALVPCDGVVSLQRDDALLLPPRSPPSGQSGRWVPRQGHKKVPNRLATHLVSSSRSKTLISASMSSSSLITFCDMYLERSRPKIFQISSWIPLETPAARLWGRRSYSESESDPS